MMVGQSQGFFLLGRLYDRLQDIQTGSDRAPKEQKTAPAYDFVSGEKVAKLNTPCG